MKFNLAPTVDLGVGGVGNYYLTKRAAADPSLRMPAWAPKDGKEPSVYSDTRFIGTLAGVGASVFGGNLPGAVGTFVSRAGGVVAQAAGHSLIATEAIRAVATEATAAGGVAPNAPRGVYRISEDEMAAAAAYEQSAAYR